MSSIHTFQWHQLNTTDVDVAEEFYRNVFGWTITQIDVTMHASRVHRATSSSWTITQIDVTMHDGLYESWAGQYRVFKQGEQFIAGLVSISEVCGYASKINPALLLRPEKYTSHWMPFVGLSNYRETYDRLRNADVPGEVLWGIPEIDTIGSICLLSGGQRNWFGIIGDLWDRTSESEPLHLVGSRSPFVGCEYYVDDTESIHPICKNTLGLGVDVRPDEGGHLLEGVQEKLTFVLRDKLADNAKSWPRCICYVGVDNVDQIREQARKYNETEFPHGEEFTHGEHAIVRAPDGSMIGVLGQEEAAKRRPQSSVS